MSGAFNAISILGLTFVVPALVMAGLVVGFRIGIWAIGGIKICIHHYNHRSAP